MLVTLGLGLIFLILSILFLLFALFFLNILVRINGSGSDAFSFAQRFSRNKKNNKASLKEIIAGDLSVSYNGFPVRRAFVSKKDGSLLARGSVSDEIINMIE